MEENKTGERDRWGGGALLVVADEVGMDIYIYIPCYRSGT